MSAYWMILIFAAIEGLLSGSFLNVCIQRLPRGRSVVRPRSSCMSCGHLVRWFDNVPVLSFLVLRGRCRDCSARVSLLYPAVELAMGVWFVFAALPFANAFVSDANAERLMLAFVHSLAVATFGFLSVGLFFMDWQTWILPDEFTIGGLCLGLFFAATESFWVPSVRYRTFFTPEEVFFGKRLAAAIAGYLVLWGVALIYRLLRGRIGMGAGDAKQLAMIGAFLGLEQLALAFFVALSTCTLYAVGLLATRRAGGKTPVPFGSFLAIGGLAAAILGERVLAWYTGLFRQ